MLKIERDDMLELTRRMTPARNCFGRIAGDYRDEEGYDDGSFNTFFLSLNNHDRDTQLSIAKAIPFSKTNEELKALDYPGVSFDSREMMKLLYTLNACELKNDALLDTFYELVAEKYKPGYEYGIYVYQGSYDVPVKGKDKEWLEGSEEVYSFMIVALCPVDKDFNPSAPEYGFLYPAFMNRSSDPSRILVYTKEGKSENNIKKLLGL